MSTERLTISEIDIPEEVETCGRRHEEDEIVGYAVVLTGQFGVKIRDLGYYDDCCLREARGEMLRRQFEARSDLDVDWAFARLDVIYEDGCRGVVG